MYANVYYYDDASVFFLSMVCVACEDGKCGVATFSVVAQPSFSQGPYAKLPYLHPRGQEKFISTSAERGKEAMFDTRNQDQQSGTNS